MKHLLSESDRETLDKRIEDTEKNTGAQIILATVRRCDNYAEIPWKAFAFGTSIAGFSVFLLNFFVFGWITNALIFFSISSVIATGFIFSILTVIIPGFARLFLSNNRKETETLQYAESLFLSHELFATSERKGILILISYFERQIVILPDKGVRTQLDSAILQKTILKMALSLKRNEVRRAFETGLVEINAILKKTEIKSLSKNELSNQIIEEEGV